MSRAADMGEIMRWLQGGRIDCTVGYAHDAATRKLHVVARLQGMPLPLLVGVPGAVPDGLRAAIRKAGDAGILLPALGPMDRLRVATSDGLDGLRRATKLAPGRRQVRRAVWSPLPSERLPLESFQPKPRQQYSLPAATGRWRTMELLEVELEFEGGR